MTLAGQYILTRSVSKTGHSALWWQIAEVIAIGVAVSVAVFAMVLGYIDLVTP